MHTFVLTDLVTLRGQSGGTPTIKQSEEELLDLAAYLDVVMWLQVTSVTLGGASAIDVNYVTQPQRSDFLTNTMASVAVTGAGVTVTPILSEFSDSSLLRYLAYAVTPASATSSAWDITFRIFVSANAPGKLHKMPSGTNPLARRLAPPHGRPSVPLHLKGH